MNQPEQVRMAYNILEKMEELSSKLWDCYFDEFIEIIFKEEGNQDQLDENVGDVGF